MAGVDYSEPVHFEREPEWHLESIIVEDEEHTVLESGGVEMAEVVLPVKRLLEEMRLRHVGAEQHPTIRHDLRSGRVTYYRREDVPRRIVKDRLNASEDVLDRHYDRRSDREQAEQRSDYLPDL